MSRNKRHCGIECVFSQISDIWDFFDFSDMVLDGFFFKTIDAFVYSNGKRIDVAETFSSDYFHELIKKKFVGELLVLHLYPENAFTEDISNYKHFVQSKCEMIILLYDCYYLEVYCKNKLWLQKMINKAVHQPGTIVEKKYEETDTRTSMYV